MQHSDRTPADRDRQGPVGEQLAAARRQLDHARRAFSGRVADALSALRPPLGDRATVVFSAHSLPTRPVDDGSLRCLRCGGEMKVIAWITERAVIDRILAHREKEGLVSPFEARGPPTGG